ncbi:hypothetical protein GHO39_02420 [Pseudomonas helleri]|uniref:Uncharacterized protein n=1 Tax=Pseudomonas helleri TaxID=1608996 RepID=A0A7X1XD43_9PSED|nr:hypothetical protein [Pseudomonas helleri]
MLFSVLHCGLGHGQAIGLTLNDLSGSFCGHWGGVSVPVSFEQWLGDGLAVGVTLDCPMCSHTGLALTPVLLAPADAHTVVHTLKATSRKSWPRRFWPPANPRASPALT